MGNKQNHYPTKAVMCTTETIQIDFIPTGSIERKYPENVLAKFLHLLPVQENGDFNCYNECSVFYLKQDTLINICERYTYDLVKSSSEEEE